MSSVRTFCVRWLTLIVVVSGVAVPVSRAVARESHPASCESPRDDIGVISVSDH